MSRRGRGGRSPALQRVLPGAHPCFGAEGRHPCPDSPPSPRLVGGVRRGIATKCLSRNATRNASSTA
eukprot:3328529-Lingulodinium_polyedra.AAC.1